MENGGSFSGLLRNRNVARSGKTSEERVFGPRFKSKLLKVQNQPVSTLGVFISACSIALSAVAMFLLGVNIVIQYRTIVPEDRAGMTRKASYIVLSAGAIYLLNKFNLWFFRKVVSYFSSGPYDRLPAQESFEMEQRA